MYPSPSSFSADSQLCIVQLLVSSAGLCWHLAGLRCDVKLREDSDCVSSSFWALLWRCAGLVWVSEFLGWRTRGVRVLTLAGFSLCLRRQRFEARRAGCWLGLDVRDLVKSGRARRDLTVSRTDSWMCWARTGFPEKPIRKIKNVSFKAELFNVVPNYLLL